jgi:urease accessory protein
MTGDIELLTALQHGDSFFPGGAMAFSWGLEGLFADGKVRSAQDVRRFLEGQLRFRWATCDRVFLVAAHRAGGDLTAVAKIDRSLAAMTMPREMRDGASRAGMALLGVHLRLGTPGADRYRALVQEGECPGHLPVVQGLLFQELGLDERHAAAISAHLLCVGIAGAALRLGIVTHIEVQAALSGMRDRIVELLAAPVPPVESARMFVPAADIASARHETQTTRLFAN